MTFRSLKQLKNLNDKTVLLRADFDVPMKEGRIEDDIRMRTTLGTINFLLKKKCRLILISHLGRPGAKINTEYSLRPIAAHLRVLLQHPVKFIPETIGPKVVRAAEKMKVGDVILLENLRFNKGELEDSPAFAKKLASLADIYVNETFSTSHRQQASFSALTKLLPTYAGLALEQEIQHLDVVKKPMKPMVIVMGGAKLKTKLPLISKFYARSNYILLGGGLANTFFKYQKQEIGRSLYDAEGLKSLKEFYEGKKLKSKIILPVDVVVKNKQGLAAVKTPDSIMKSDTILDIGPDTINKYSGYIKKAQTLICNGTMGKFEEKSFKHGSLAILSLVAARSTGRAYGIVGGGDTLKALKMTKMTEHVDWVSMGGGATLTYLSGGAMPGLKKIIKK